MKNSIKVKRAIVKSGRFVGETGHGTTVVTKRKMRMAARRIGKVGEAGMIMGHETKKDVKKAVRVAYNRGSKNFPETAHGAKMLTKKQIRMGARNMEKLGEAGHGVKIVAKRQARKGIRRVKNVMPMQSRR